MFKRCDWKVGLDAFAHILPALRELRLQPDFHRCCRVVKQKAKEQSR